MDYKVIELSLVAIINALGIALSYFIYLADRKTSENRLFSFFSLIAISWIDFGYLSLHVGDYYCLLLTRLNVGIVPAFFIIFYYFSVAFSGNKKNNLILGKIIKYSGVLLCIIASFTPLVVKNVIVEQWGTSLVSGRLADIYYLWIVVVLGIILYRQIKQFLKSNKIERSKITYFMIGFFVFAAINVVVNVILPTVFHTSRYYKLGDYSIIIFIIFTAYAILKHNLFNIKIIATESIVILLSVGLFVQAFISGSAVEYILKFIIWALATYGGWLLIKSVKIEIKQKEELEHLAKKLEEANSHLKELDQMKDDFLGMASHELNTPLAAIEGYLSMILEENMCGELNSKTKEYLNRIFNSSQRLSAIVKDLLNVSRIESGRIHLIYAEVQIEDLIKQAVSEIDPKVKEKKHTTCLELPAEPLPKSWMDATRITEVILNLLSNAVKYTNDNGHIEIGAKFKDKDVLVWVKDDGRGIPEDKADKVFAKFTQVDVLKDEVKGTGLGMYISKKFVELHDGKIWFESKGEGKGTTFFFSLPIHKEKPFDPHDGSGPVLR